MKAVHRPGYHSLWEWFGLSRASFAVMPRVLMHEMPDEWQAKMAALLEEYEATFDTSQVPGCKVMAVGNRNRFKSWPDWLLNYRHPDRVAVDQIRHKPCQECGQLGHCRCCDALLAKVTADVEKGAATA